MRSYLGTSNINNIAPWVHGAHTKYHSIFMNDYNSIKFENIILFPVYVEKAFLLYRCVMPNLTKM